MTDEFRTQFSGNFWDISGNGHYVFGNTVEDAILLRNELNRVINYYQEVVDD